MKNQILFTLALFAGAASTFSQPCALETLLKQPGNWLLAKPNPNPDAGSVTAADLARQRAIINSITQPIQKKYAPKGVDIEISSAYMDNSRIPNVQAGNYYTADWAVVKHNCPYSKADIIEKLSEARELYMVRLHINDFALTFFGRTHFVPEQPDQENPWTDAFALIDKQPVKEGVAWYWRGGGSGSSYQHYWLIVQDDKFPFSYISRREFAERLKGYYQRKIKEAELGYANNSKMAEETYQRLKKINATEADKFKQQSAVQYKKQLDIEKTQYTKNLAVVDNILASDKAPEEPAIIDRIKGEFDFNGFVNADHDYASWVIKPNPSYFNPRLPKSTPQFMALYCDTQDEPIFKMAREELLKAIDFASLKSMLGK